MEGALPAAEVLFEGMFDPAIQVAGKAVTAATGLAVLYYKLRTAVIGRDQAAYSVATHLPQAFDRAAIATLRGQRQLVAVLELALGFQALKSRMHEKGQSTEAKAKHFLEMLAKSVAYMLVATYCFSCLACALSIRRAIIVLDYIREVQALKRQTEHNSWGSLLQGAAQSAVITALQSSLGAAFGGSPFDRDCNTGMGSDSHVAAALERQIPLLAEIALRVAESELVKITHNNNVKEKVPREAFVAVLKQAWTRFEELVELKVQPFAKREFTHRTSSAVVHAASAVHSRAAAALHVHASVETIDAQGNIIDEAEVDIVEGLGSERGSARRQSAGKVDISSATSWSAGCLRDLDDALSSPEFCELTSASASEMFDDAVAVMDTAFTAYANYDGEADAAPLFVIALGLDKSRQQYSAVSVPVPDYVRFFCEEMVRSTSYVR